MKPTISVDNEHAIVTTRFAPDMTLDEIQGFLKELRETIEDFGDRGASFSILNNAAYEAASNWRSCLTCQAAPIDERALRARSETVSCGFASRWAQRSAR